MTTSKKIAVVTPYYKDSSHYLSRCIESVKNQKYLDIEHFLISDGCRNSIVDEYEVRHIIIDRNHNDNGNTPRGFGSLLAIAEGFDAICLLDADNWLEPNHIFLCLDAATNSELSFNSVDYVYSRRNFKKPDGTSLDWTQETNHIDTSELMLFRGSFPVLSRWSLMPNKLSPICDKVFYLMLKSAGLKGVCTEQKTVNFTMLYPQVYKSMKLPIPAEANHEIDWKKIKKFIDGLAGRDRQIVCKNMGIDERTDFSIKPFEMS